MTHNPQAGVHPLKDTSPQPIIKFRPTFHLISLNGFNKELENYVGMFFRLLSKEVPHKDPLNCYNISIKTDYETEIYDEIVAVGKTYTLKGYSLKIQTHVFDHMLCRRFTKQLMADIQPNSIVIFVVSASDLIKRLRCWTLLDYWNYYMTDYSPTTIDRYHPRTTHNCVEMFEYVYNFHKNMSKHDDFNESYPVRNKVLITLTSIENYKTNVQLELIQDMNLNTKCINRIRKLERVSDSYSIDSWWAINDLLKCVNIVPQRSFRTIDDVDYSL